jgi:hypothetical protein
MRILLFIVCLSGSILLQAQKNDTVISHNLIYTSPEQFIGLPAQYSRAMFDASADHKGEVFLSSYTLTPTDSAQTVTVIRSWRGWLTRFHTGDKIWVFNIRVKQDGKVIKLMDKTFIVP